MAKKEDDNTIIFLLLGAGLLFFLLRKKQPPTPEKTEQVLKNVFNNLNFEYNKAVIKPESFNSLNELFDVLNQTEWKLILSGYTDDKGSADYNLKLSNDRANAVKNYLVNKGIDANRISAKGYGENNPIAPNDTDENRAKNRRVEFKIVIEETNLKL